MILIVDLNSVVHRLDVTNDRYALLTESNENPDKTVENVRPRIEKIIQALPQKLSSAVENNSHLPGLFGFVTA